MNARVLTLRKAAGTETVRTFSEWKEHFNPFNSAKALYWGEFLRSFYEGHRPPPITADVEPTNACNIDCVWCYPMMTGFREVYKGHMRAELLLALPAFLKQWGVRSAQITGGGEPLFHPVCHGFFRELLRVELPFGLITNGVLFDEESIGLVLEGADWCGFSIDAGTAETWSRLKKSPEKNFYRILQNLERINKAKRRTRVAYKYLLYPYNYSDIPTAVRLARELGCDDFHLRPAYTFETFAPSQIEEINIMLHEIKEYETDAFRVYTIKHKFEKTLTQQALTFPRCIATPLLLTFSADHQTYTCLDHRGEEHFRLADFGDGFEGVLEAWGSPRHLEALRSIQPSADCQKCTFKGYNDLFNNLDKMMVTYL